ncbi:MAG: HPr family phosphocarrier protein [Alphaproteobacteria bacterium]
MEAAVTTAKIVNKRGLHARASAKFVETVCRFQCEITVSREGASVSGRSIMGLMMLAAPQGAELMIRAEGADAHDALAALTRLIAVGFHED